MAAAYGVRFHLPPDLLAVNRTLGLDLNAFNGDDSGTLPVPSRFIVDGDGGIRYTVVDPDYTVRPTPEHTLEALRTQLACDHPGLRTIGPEASPTEVV